MNFVAMASASSKRCHGDQISSIVGIQCGVR
jgi:hypothetical protein